MVHPADSFLVGFRLLAGGELGEGLFVVGGVSFDGLDLLGQLLDLLLEIGDVGVTRVGVIDFLVDLVEVLFRLDSGIVEWRSFRICEIGILPDFADISPKLENRRVMRLLHIILDDGQVQHIDLSNRVLRHNHLHEKLPVFVLL